MKKPDGFALDEIRTKERIFACSGGVLVGIVALAGMIMNLPRANAESTTDSMLINVTSSCSMTSNVSSPHSATIVNGMYEDEIGQTNITAFCNDANGHAVYAIGYSDNQYGNTAMISDVNPVHNIATGTATSGDTSNWAMKLMPVDGTYKPIVVGSTADIEKEVSTPDFSDYTNVPSTYTRVVYSNASTDVVEGSAFETTYAAYIASLQMNGGYTGKVKYTLVHPSSNEACISYNVVFDANGGSGTMAPQEICVNESTVLYANTFVAPSGLNILSSWNTEPDGTGTRYLPDATVINLAQADETVTLYAQWSNYMQDLTQSTIAALLPDIGSTAVVMDARDDQEYTIAKLADGKYWMTTNLNLAGGTSLYSDTSDVPNGYISNPYFILPVSSTSGFSTNATAYVYNSGNTINCGASGQSDPCFSYYSWVAATAGGKDSSNRLINSDGYNAPYSICPKGWRLPTSTTSNASAMDNWKTGDWYGFITALGGNLETNPYQNSNIFYNNASFGTIPNFLLTGFYANSSFYAGGTDGDCWSSTYLSSSYAYGLYFNPNYVNSADDYYRANGLSIRCLFRTE